MNNVISQERIEIPKREVEPKSLREFYDEVDAMVHEKLSELNYDNKDEVSLYYKVDDNPWFEESNKVRNWLISLYEACENGERQIENLPKLEL